MIEETRPVERFCVFCGGTPSDKTNEHVVPRWLLRMTGKINRRAHFGREWTSPEFKERNYSWDSFAFPACNPCNERWSDIEADTKRVMERMMRGDALSAGDLYGFLDWMDKVRVGMWLGIYYLNDNYRAIIHRFHIDDRVGQQDRALFIFETQEQPKGIGLVGVDTPIFHTMPSTLYLIVNQFHFISVSKPFMLAERFGWPYVREMKMKDIDTDGFSADLVPGHGEIAPAIFTKLPTAGGTILMQPIAHPAARSSTKDPDLYAAANVVRSSQPGKKGVGKLFIGTAAPAPYPDGASICWQPLIKYPLDDLMRSLSPWFGALQRELYLDGPSYAHFPEEDRRRRETEMAGVVKLHDMIVAHYLTQLAGSSISLDGT